MRTVTVKGIGEVKAAPDTAILQLTLSAVDKSCEKCSAIAGEQSEELKKAAAALGFGTDELRTGRYDLSVRYEDSHAPDGRYVRTFAGFCCTQVLTLRFAPDMERVSEVLTAFAACKSQPELQISFSLIGSEACHAEALAAAAANARTTAEALCRASGTKLGQLVRIVSGTDGMNTFSSTDMCLPNAVGASLRMAKAALPEPEDVSVSASATFEWEIE